MRAIKFNEILELATPGSVVSYKEYSLDHVGKRRLSLEVEKASVDSVIKPSEQVYIGELERIYGVELGFETYCALATSTCIRLVLNVAVNSEPKYKVISLNQDFYEMDYQQLCLEDTQADVPVYVGSNGWY